MADEVADIEIETSTDTVEDVKAALGDGVEIEESLAEESEEKPGEEAEESKEKPKEGESEESAEEEPEARPDKEQKEGREPKAKGDKEAKPAKEGDLPTVPKARLNEEIRKRRTAERELAALKGRTLEPESDDDTPTAKVKEPEFFSGKPEPTLEEFTKDVDVFDGKAMAEAMAKFTKSFSAWSREEARATANYLAEQQRVIDEANARKKDFIDRQEAFAQERPEYREIVNGSTVNIDSVTEDFIYESEIGPAMIMYFAENPKEARRFFGMRGRTRSTELIKLEADIKSQLQEESEAEEGEEESVEEPPKRTIPPKKPVTKTVSKAPIPPNRLKPSGPGPKSERELAGPDDRTGVDLEYNPEYEKAVKTRKGSI